MKMKNFTLFSIILSSFILSSSVISCNRETDPGVLEKVALLEAELRSRDEELETLRGEAASAKSVPLAASMAPDVDNAKSGYLACIEKVKVGLLLALPSAKFERTSVFPVEAPDTANPIFSRVAFRVIAADGRSGEIGVKLSANAAGQWQEPDLEEAVTTFKTKAIASQSSPAITQTAPSNNLPQIQPSTLPKDVMGANRTVEVGWGDKQTSTSPPTIAPVPPTSPATPAIPPKVMPTNRDVIIDFDN